MLELRNNWRSNHSILKTLEQLDERPFAGHLYQPGDYTTAANLTRQLIVNPTLRQEMAHAGRREVETKGWLSAIHRIRDTQYQRAIKTFRAHKRYNALSMRRPTASHQLF